MEDKERIRSRKLIGKVLISEETGKKFGIIGDIDFVTESGELINLVLTEKTSHTDNLNLQQDEKNRMLIPFTSVKSVGDFVIVSEKDIM
jgi:sporulation protein YlmC with PRC-barrel domain